MFLVNIACTPRIDITQRDQIISHVVKGIETAAALPSNANASDVQFAVRLVRERQLAVAQNQQTTACDG
jgi:hypothetical protein